jgi:putative RNA 2'-phosphotransferase
MDAYSIRLSKFLSFILRHAPDKYELKLDKHGYAGLEDVIGVLQVRFKYFKKEDLFHLVRNDPKQRFEIAGDKIRATYGHSVEVVPKTECATPPDILYHGTSAEGADRILADGLKPMGRQFVHLSLNEEDAYSVGLRHTESPVILKIMAKDASLKGVKFFKEGSLFITEYVPHDYIKISENK